MILHVVRHAESLANINKSTIVDCDLSDLGCAQMKAVASELARRGIDRVLSSPYRRALRTGATIASAAGKPLEVLPLLHEHHPTAFSSEWPLLSRAALIAEFPGLVLPDDFMDRDWLKPPETEGLVLERMASVLRDLESRFSPGNERVVLVTHGSPASKLIEAFFGVTEPGKVLVAIANASISTLEIVAGRRNVLVVNDTSHLRDVVAEPAVTTSEPVYL